MEDIEQAYDELHQDYEHRKNEIITKLITIKKSSIPEVYREWLTQTIEFIKQSKELHE